DGFADTHEIAERLAARLTDSAGEIAVCSTGLIGERLAMGRLLPGVDAAAMEASRSGGPAAADAIRTTDTVVKIAFRRCGRAGGASGVRPEPGEFAGQLTEVCADLARQLQLDAEGAGKAIAVEVVGAASERDAVTVGRAVARSALLKCAIAGEDPNWGRVLAA